MAVGNFEQVQDSANALSREEQLQLAVYCFRRPALSRLASKPTSARLLSQRIGSGPRKTGPGQTCSRRRNCRSLPVSDLTDAKRHPALVLADLDGDDVSLCTITNRAVTDRHAMPLDAADFQTGGLPVPSNIRPRRPFTADAAIIVKSVGRLNTEKLSEAFELPTAASHSLGQQG